MPSLRIAAVAALATAALVVPATASAKDEAATAAVIGNTTPLQVNVPSESAWTRCAPEGGSCAFTGTKQVRYGANGKFTLPRTFTDGVACNNAVFGDPVPGVAKECQVTAVSQTKDEAATAAAISTQPIAPAGSQQPPPSDPACLLAAVGMERLKSLQQEIKDAQSRGDITLVQALTNRYSQELEATSSQQKQCLAAKENAAANVGP